MGTSSQACQALIGKYFYGYKYLRFFKIDEETLRGYDVKRTLLNTTVNFGGHHGESRDGLDGAAGVIAQTVPGGRGRRFLFYNQ